MLPPSAELTGNLPAPNDLEGRLRGMILTNAGPNPVPGPSPPVPPHMFTAGPAAQQAYLAAQESRLHSQSPQTQPQNQSNSSVQSAPTGRRKPNQAQRRQMNTELSIPINPRPNTTALAGRGNPFGHNYQQPTPSPHYNGPYQPQNNQRYQNQQQSSPRLPNATRQMTPYPPRGPHPQAPPQSSMNHYSQDLNSNYQSQPRYSSQFQQQQHSPGIGPASPYARPPAQHRQLYQPGLPGGQGRARPVGFSADEIANQGAHLERLVQVCTPTVGIDPDEEAEKEDFRAVVEQACQEVIGQHEKDDQGDSNFDLSTVELKCFGSMSSGFATKASDMDLALLTPHSKLPADSPESAIPRLLEKKLLDMGFGARLLTRTRVPIIKLCQKPTKKLRDDLLEERSKWENGFIDEGDDHPAIEPNNVTKDITPKEDVLSSPEPSPAEVTTNKAGSNLDQLAKLKQKEGQSLTDYGNKAKRLLRILGGRDISVGAPNLTEEESILMNEVCKALIFGLSSESLVVRLQSYQSISPLFNPSLVQLRRSLNGVLTQVEGERLVMAFENRPLTERDDRREAECANIVEGWRSLQDKFILAADPIPYNRLLFLSGEKLKTISSLQLVFLEQPSHEEPVCYQKRAQKILDELNAREQSDKTTVAPIVLAHYISGINNAGIRDILDKSTQHRSTLQKVALQHRVLQLALDYEHALKKELFDESSCTNVEKYVALLRERIINEPPMTSDSDAALVSVMRTLPDPTTISQMKPRDRYKDHLEFPKNDIGIQCDINFSAHLGLQNTLLLRCYAHSDPRVKILILFVKQWAKVRGINSSYRGTLSSYGYVLMVLHYLVNIAQPFVCPNLQIVNKDPPASLPPAEIEARTSCKGRDVRFWRNEAELRDLSARGLLNHNHDSVGVLARGFFEYYAHTGPMSTVQNRGFDWGRDVLSLRTHGGILSKQEKGWVGAKTVIETTTIAAPPMPSTPAHPPGNGDVNGPETSPETKPVKPKTIEETKEIRHRYLFAIEDPFELDHNVARTVTHNGIVAIRDEFRRAWRLIQNIGHSYQVNDLMAPIVNATPEGNLKQLFDLIHGPEPRDAPAPGP